MDRFDLQGGSNNEFSPSAESISEFKLQTGTIGAQYGGGQTAVANFAVKSGTNNLHGSAYDYIQNDVLRANSLTNNAIGKARAPYKLNNYGGAIGGPVYIPKLYNGKNRTFFFFNYERTRVRDFNSLAFTTLPTTDMKRGDFSRLLDPAYTGNSASGTVVGTDALGRPVRFGQIYDPRTTRTVNGQVVRDPFTNNIIPQTAWSNVSRKVVQDVGIDDPVLSTLFNNMPNLSACCPVFNEHMVSAKVDHNLTDRQRIAAFFSMNNRRRNNSPTGRWGPPPGLPTNVYQDQYTPGRMVRLAHDWTIYSIDHQPHRARLQPLRKSERECLCGPGLGQQDRSPEYSADNLPCPDIHGVDHSGRRYRSDESTWIGESRRQLQWLNDFSGRPDDRPRQAQLQARNRNTFLLLQLP